MSMEIPLKSLPVSLATVVASRAGTTSRRKDPNLILPCLLCDVDKLTFQQEKNNKRETTRKNE
jgi:hypothetical protein